MKGYHWASNRNAKTATLTIANEDAKETSPHTLLTGVSSDTTLENYLETSIISEYPIVLCCDQSCQTL